MGNSASSALPYSIGTEEHPAKFNSYRTGWALHSGSQKSNPSQPVTVFKFSKSANAISSANPLDAEVRLLGAQHHFQKIKTLVHPHLLRAYATLDTDNPDGTIGSASSGSADATLKGDFIIVTEYVVPLSIYLNQIVHSTDDESDNTKVIYNTIAWGLVTMIEALHFLHSTAQLSHGRVCMDSIYVTRGGDFKLGDFSLLTKIDPNNHTMTSSTIPRLFTDLQSILTPKAYMSPERLEQTWDLVSSCPPHIMDSYSMGILIQDLYTGYSTDGAVPQKLIKAVQRLTTSNVKLRPRIAPLLKCPVFVENNLVQANSNLDNLATKPAEEKIVFLQKLPDFISKNILHKRITEYKLLPALVSSVQAIIAGIQNGALQQDVQRREILAIIPPLYQITQNVVTVDNIKTPTFTHTITPVLTSLFTINDRGIRGALLSRFIPILAANLPANTLNTAVFEPMCSGFSDSSTALRELTLKSSLPIVPFLTSQSMDKLCRYLIRLQSDAEPSVRTNTIIFVGKIASTLSPTNRANLILPAFTRAMTDDFTPCRLAALRAVLVCKSYFDSDGIAKKVLPVVVPHLVDSVSNVRAEAYAVVDAFMVILREESEKKKLEEASEGNETNESKSDTSNSSSQKQENTSSSRYFSGLSSWAVGAISSQPNPSTTTASSTSAPAPAPAPAPTPTPTPTSSSLLSNMNIDDDGDDDINNDGWSDEDDDDHDHLRNDDMSHEPSWVSNPTPTASKITSVEDEDAIFASAFASTTTKSVVSSTSMNSSSKKLITPKLVMNKPKSQTKALSLSERKAEFEKRKLERMEKRTQQWDKGKGNSQSTSKRSGTGRGLDGWNEFSR